MIDLTQLSDKEILHLIKEANGRFCCRARSSQLDRPLAEPVTVKHTALLKKAVAGLLAFHLVQPGKAQYALNTPAMLCAKNPYTDNIPNSQPHTDLQSDTAKIMITGKVLDSATLQPLEGAMIELKGTGYKTVTDHQGEFKIPLAKIYEKSSLTITASYVGYKRSTLILPISETAQPVSMTLKMQESALLGITAISYRKKRWWQIWK